MKILLLCNRIPFPPTDGGTVAISNMASGLLSQGAEVKVFCLNPSKNQTSIEQISANDKPCEIESVDIDTSLSIAGAIKELLRNRSYNISRFDQAHVHERLIAYLKTHKFDLIQIESLFMVPYLKTIRAHSTARVVLRAHNVEASIWKGITGNATNIFKKTYLAILTRQLASYENKIFKEFDAIVPISSADSEFIATKLGASHTIPIHLSVTGIDLSRFIPKPELAEKDSLFHLGSMDWEPNIYGIEWFLGKAWPMVVSLYPDLKFYLAGKNMPSHLKELKVANYINVGAVADTVEFMNSKKVMIVPLFAGSGIRIKILEGMALGKTIIATPLALQGIDYTAGKNIIVAQNSHDFYEKIIKCFTDVDYADMIGASAREFAVENFDQDKQMKNLYSFYEQLIKGKI
jgi:glycosyltransferase involved in cell wall biosynthesis